MVDAAAVLPWWLGVAFAVLAFLLMRWLAMPDSPVSNAARQPGVAVGQAMTRGLAAGGQILLPIIFLAGAVISAFTRAKRKHVLDQVNRVPEWRAKPPASTSKRRPIESDRYLEWKDAEPAKVDPAPSKWSQWSLQLLNRLEWKRFEYLCARYFEELGFRAKTARAGPDGGVDIHLFAEGERHPGVIVQCKAWRSKQIGVNLVRELFGVMAADKVGEGILITTSSFTSDALNFAKSKNIHLIDGEDFLGKLDAFSPEKQQSLLEFATEGDYTTPTCPSCGIKMALREPKAGGDSFWGCREYPRCRTTMPISRMQ